MKLPSEDGSRIRYCYADKEELGKPGKLVCLRCGRFIPWNVPGWMIYSGISVKNTDLSWINAIWFCMVTADAAKMNKDR